MDGCAARRLGVVNLPPETLDLLRFGRGVDNRRLKGAGFDVPLSPRAGAVRHFVEAQRLRRVVGETEPPLPIPERTWRRSSGIPRRSSGNLTGAQPVTRAG